MPIKTFTEIMMVYTMVLSTYSCLDAGVSKIHLACLISYIFSEVI